jgi:CRISPR-associated protein Csd1
VCEECVEAYTRALNELLSRNSTHYREGDLVFCFWTRDPTDDDWTVLNRADPEQVKRLFGQPRTPSGDPAAVNPNRFYALSLSGVGGRAMVRAWIEETVPRVRENLCRWFGDLGIALDRPLKDKHGAVWASPGDEYYAWPLWRLNRALGRRGDRGTEIPRDLPATLFQSAIRGTPLANSVLAAAVRRIQAEHGIPPARAALLRLTLNRTWQSTQKGRQAMTSGLDVSRPEPGYLCGRMLAVLARLQYLALGSTNATIVDRYYGAASSAPVTVFGRLTRLARAHLKELSSRRKGAAVNIEKDIEEILAKLAGWPRQLSLEDQALFALGFYHQRAEYRRRPTDQGGSEGDEPIPVATEEASEVS